MKRMRWTGFCCRSESFFHDKISVVSMQSEGERPSVLLRPSGYATGTVMSMRIPMHGHRIEGGQANGDIFGALGPRRAVAHPFAALGDDGLPGLYFQHAALRFHMQRAFQHHRVLVKLGLLARLAPT